MDVVQECKHVFTRALNCSWILANALWTARQKSRGMIVSLLSALMLPHLVSCAVLVFLLVTGGLGARAPDERDQGSQKRFFHLLPQHCNCAERGRKPQLRPLKEMWHVQSDSVTTRMAWPTQSVPLPWEWCELKWCGRPAPQLRQTGERESCPTARLNEDPVAMPLIPPSFLFQCRHGCAQERSGC